MEENQEHVLLHCNWARVLWFSHPMGLQTGAIQGRISQWLMDVFSKHEQDDVAQILYCLWAVWRARNDRIFNNKLMDPATCVSLALSQLVEWQDQQDGDGSARKQEKEVPRW